MSRGLDEELGESEDVRDEFPANRSAEVFPEVDTLVETVPEALLSRSRKDEVELAAYG